VIGFVFLANVLGVVVAQMPISRLLQGRSRMRSLALAAALWGAALLLVELATVPGGSLAAVVLVTAGAVFAIGECLHAPIVSPLTADLAPEALRGRYMALVTNSFAIGFTIGPALAGAILGVAPFALLPLAAAACIAGGGLALALERRLPEQARLTPA
jgi:MFS family permease